MLRTSVTHARRRPRYLLYLLMLALGLPAKSSSSAAPRGLALVETEATAKHRPESQARPLPLLQEAAVRHPLLVSHTGGQKTMNKGCTFSMRTPPISVTMRSPDSACTARAKGRDHSSTRSAQRPPTQLGGDASSVHLSCGHGEAVGWTSCLAISPHRPGTPTANTDEFHCT